MPLVITSHRSTKLSRVRNVCPASAMNVLSTLEEGEAAANAELLEGNSSPSELLSDKSRLKVLKFLSFTFCGLGGVSPPSFSHPHSGVCNIMSCFSYFFLHFFSCMLFSAGVFSND